jgi:hypothetical protein
MKSKLFSINWLDFARGLVVAVVTAVLSGLYNIISAGGAITVKSVIIPAVLALLAYLLKNLFTNSQDQILAPEPPKVIDTEGK